MNAVKYGGRHSIWQNQQNLQDGTNISSEQYPQNETSSVKATNKSMGNLVI